MNLPAIPADKAQHALYGAAAGCAAAALAVLVGASPAAAAFAAVLAAALLGFLKEHMDARDDDDATIADPADAWATVAGAAAAAVPLLAVAVAG
jgi:hypothetical protein